MKAHFGIEVLSNRWYASVEVPCVTEWGSTEEEAKKKLCEHLTEHYGLTIVGWANFSHPGTNENS